MGAIERGELGKRVQVPTNSGRISELEITKPREHPKVAPVCVGSWITIGETAGIPAGRLDSSGPTRWRRGWSLCLIMLEFHAGELV